ncbi:MAG: hypothetical protein COA69_13065 [Robiginitomaculum sp.]|nr:MAG: hypothetical protein COA69_13065 [Robiginitomaculum sp.]
MQNHKFIFRVLTVAFFTGTAFCAAAQVPDAASDMAAPPMALSSVFACRTLDDEQARLSCYDKAVGRLETAQKSGDIIAVSKADVEVIERESFGFNIPSLPKLGKLFGDAKNTVASVGKKAFKPKDIESGRSNVVLEISRTKIFGYKQTRFYLKNGQVWQQVDNKRIRVSKKTPGNAHIRKAALGSFLLQVNGRGPAIGVKRVR